MPYAKKRVFRKKKRPTNRRYKKRYGRRRIPLGIQSKKTQLARLRYTQAISLNSGASGTLDKHFFKCNGCYDPDTSGTGHQPMAWDQYTALYNHYVVLGSKMTCQFSFTASTSQSPPIVGIFKSDDTTTSAIGITTLIEQNRCVYKMMSPSFIAKPVTLTSKFSTKKHYNVKDVKDNLDRLGAAVNADPTELAEYCVFTGTLDDTTDGDSVVALVTIDYIVAFSEPKELTQS